MKTKSVHCKMPASAKNRMIRMEKQRFADQGLTVQQSPLHHEEPNILRLKAICHWHDM
jgi:uncharacterized protein YaeQ